MLEEVCALTNLAQYYLVLKCLISSFTIGTEMLVESMTIFRHQIYKKTFKFRMHLAEKVGNPLLLNPPYVSFIFVLTVDSD